MPYANWDPAMAIGVDEIDGQHRELLGILNRLQDQAHGPGQAAGAGMTGEESLRALADYARRHFACEEGHMERAGFPGLAVQRRQHEEFTRRVADAQLEAACCGAPVSATIDFLKHWLVEHIMGQDLAFRRFLDEG